MRFTWSRWLRSLSQPKGRTIRKLKSIKNNPWLEILEDRTAPAALPAPVVTDPIVLNPDLPDNPGPQGDHPFSDAQIAYNPLNPQQVVAVASYNPVAPNNLPSSNPGSIIAGFRIWVSNNSGATWSAPVEIDNLEDPTDFTTPNQVHFTQNEGASIAFDTLNNIYVVSTQRNAANTSGAIVLHKFNVGGGIPNEVDLNQSTAGVNPEVLYRWLNQDPAFHPTVAIDTNVPSYTDPDTGVTITDPMAGTFSRAINATIVNGGTGYSVNDELTVQGGVFNTPTQVRVTSVNGSGAITGITLINPGAYRTEPNNPAPVTGGSGTDATVALTFNVSPKAIYVAWNTLFTNPDQSNPATLSRIWTAVSGDGGLNFTSPQFVSAGGSPSSTPKIAFTQGSADGRVPGGQVMFFWSGSLAEPANPLLFNRIIMDSSTPDGGISTNSAGVGYTFTNPASVQINDAFVPGTTPPNNIPGETDIPLTVSITDPLFTTLNDLDVKINLRHQHLNQLSIVLISPSGTQITLLQNAVNPDDGAAFDPARGLADVANLGVTIGGDNNAFTQEIGTVFNQQAPRSITDPTAAAPYVGHFRPELGSLNVFNGLTANDLNGTWTLRITDNISNATADPPEVQFLSSWSLTFTSSISTGGFGADQTILDEDGNVVTTVSGSITTQYPTVTAASGPAGISPGISVAVDNSLGSFSPHQGTIYVGFTRQGSGVDTDVMLLKSTDGGTSWIDPVRLNDDSAADNFSEGNRPQFNPSLAVDPVTGTLVATWYDARWDAALARVATYITTSIDGGETFSPQTFLNVTKTALDAITQEIIDLEPIPGNQSRAGALGFGTHHGLTVYGGKVYSAFASNFNGTQNPANLTENLSRIFVPIVTISSGPRVIFGDMGPVIAPFFTGGVIHNNTVTEDGTRQLDGFVIEFDRPIDPDSFTGDDVTLQFRDPLTPAGDPPNLVLTGDANFTISPLNTGADFGPGLSGGHPLASIFLVSLNTPLSAVGTYSYAIAPTINDRMRTRFGSTGNEIDQDQDSIQANPADPDTDTFAIPRPENGVPFQLPYTTDTLPLIIPGPHLVDTSVAFNPEANLNASDNVILNSTNNAIDVTFDRDVQVNSFGPSNINRIVGPVGPITTYIAPPTVTFTGGGGTGAAGIPILGPGGEIVGVQITSVGSGYVSPPLVSFNSDSGVGAIATSSVANGRLTAITVANGGRNYGIPTLSIPDQGTVTSSFNVNDSLMINDLAVSLRLTHGNTADLTVVLIAPDGTRVQLFDGLAGTSLNNTIFDHFATSPIFAGATPYDGRFRPVPGLETALLANGGENYLVGDLLTVQGGTFGSQAVLRVTEVAPGSGAIVSVEIVRPGMYTALPTQPAEVVGGSGTGATFNLTLGKTLKDLNRGNYLGTWTLSITDHEGGSTGVLHDWSLNPLRVTAQGPFRVFEATLATGGAGTGYTVGDILIAQGGTGLFAEFEVTSIDGSGAITGFSILNNGNYVTRPTNPVSVLGGTGSGALFNLTYAGRTFRVSIPTQSRSGTYSFVFGADSGGNYVTDVNGNQLDTNLNAGLDVLRGGDPNNGTLLPQTYDSGPISTTLNPVSTVDATIDVSEAFLVQDVNVQLSITHQNIPDLEATLISPDGTQVLLFRNVGKSGSTPHANFTNTVFDDSATNPIQFAVTVPTIGIGPGPFQPQTQLSLFRNVSSLGTWTLRIRSNSSTLVGTLTNWKLTLLNPVPGSGLGEDVADQFSASFRLFTQDPTDSVSQESWTAVGPASIQNGSGSGRIGGLALDPSDPSGNTVYVSGASGGIWKTTNFLDPTSQPTWIALTDFGPGLSLNTGAIAVFGRNNDPNQSIIFVATGEGDTGTPGVGFLRSMDGGRTWRVLNSRVNADASGQILPIDSPLRDNVFFNTTAFEVVVDPTPLPNGEVLVYAALSGTNGGIWRSRDTGKTWTLLRAGNATDVVLAAGSGDALQNGNLQILYGAFRGEGVFYTTTAPTGGSMSLRNGGNGNQLRKDVDNTPAPGGTEVPVNNLNFNPNGANGRIVLAAPALSGDDQTDDLLSGWLYAAVVTIGDTLEGLYMTKDFGLNWTRVRIPTFELNGIRFPTNDELKADMDPLTNGGAIGGQGNYDIAMAVDPNNPNVVYLTGMADNAIRIDVTKMHDAHALVAYDNSNNDGGLGQFETTGGIGIKPSGGNSATTNLPLGPGRTFGLTNELNTSILNMIRDPENPFLVQSTTFYTNVANFSNTGQNATWKNIETKADGGDYHEIIAYRDPLTGETRLMFGTDHDVATGLQDSNGNEIAEIGTVAAISGTRNGNIQLTQFYYGAAQPSTLAAEMAGALFYGGAQDDGFPVSSFDLLETGDLNWGGSARGDGGGVATDQTGSGTVYDYRWPCCGANPTYSDFFLLHQPGLTSISRVTGLLQSGDDPGQSQGQWPLLGTINFAVNPIDPTAIVISSSVGRIFRTSGFATGTGRQWFPIADPTDLDSTQSLAMAFGAPANDEAPLSDFIYVGTNGGRIFVTFNGGGVGGGANSWTDISAGLSGGSVQAIVTNPDRGSREAYAVTSNGVFWMADSGAPGATWVNVTGNLFSTQLRRVLFNDPNQQLSTLRSLKALQADWRYAIPDDLNNPDGPKHPVLYVGGEGGVFRSLDKGVTWTYFPDIATDGAIQEGGLLPSADVRDLDFVLGNINPLNGRPQEAFGRNMLVASTYGRGTFAIRLNDQILLANGRTLFEYAVSKVAGPHVIAVAPANTGSAPLTGVRVTFSSAVDPNTFRPEDVHFVTDPFGNAVEIANVIDVTPGGNPNLHNIYFVQFATPQSALGFYRVSLGPNISDYSGNRMDQDQDAFSGGSNGEPIDDVFTGRFLFQPGVNSAPVLNDVTAEFPPILEDENPNDGFTVAEFLAANPTLISDNNDPAYEPPTGRTAPRGIAVTSVDNTNGLWQYSLDGGETWVDFNATTAVSEQTARLLEADEMTRLRFLPNLNFNSNFDLATFVFRAWDLTSGLSLIGASGGVANTSPNGGNTAFSSTTAVSELAIIPVNDPPIFTKGPDIFVDEDEGPKTYPGWATNILPYPDAPPPLATDEASQIVTFLVTTDNPDLFSEGPAISSDGTLTFTTAPNAVGSAIVTVIAMDDGGTDNGGINVSEPQTFVITVTPVNDPPSFTKGPDQEVLEDAGPQTVPGWATDILPGPPDEVAEGQSVIFIVTTDNPGLFLVAPEVSPDGTLTYVTAPNANGSATVTVIAMDDGGTANSGVDTSAPQTFVINVIPVNDPPSFTKGPDQEVLEDAGPQTVPNWATDILPYPASPPPLATDEAGQIVTFLVTTDNPDLFLVAPAITSDGTLTYVTAPNANGSATVTVIAMDDGGTDNGGINVSEPQTFVINVIPVNDPPSFTKGPDQEVLEDAGPQTVPNWATDILPYPASPPPLATDEAGQIVTFLVTTDNPDLFLVAPAIASDGTLTYVTAPNANGSATVTVIAMDDGGTNNGGVNVSDPQTFVINVIPVNDAPSIAADDPPPSLEDAGPQTVDNWATFVPGPDNESDQSPLAYTVTDVSDPSLFSVLPSVDVNGTLTYTLAPNAFGSSTFTVIVQDNGGTANGGVDTSAPQTFTITGLPVNDPPSFTADNPPDSLEDGGPQTVPGWVTSFSPGPDNESDQTVAGYVVSNVSNPSLFSVLPSVDVNGTLTYTLAPDAFGSSTFDVQVRDSGGTANGGIDLSAPQTFTINAIPVNDAPSFVASDPPGVNNASGLQTVPNWSTFIPGPANESDQSVLAYLVSDVSNPSLFTELPAIDANGTLTYVLAANASGVTTFTVRVQDDGGTTNGGIDVSEPQTFRLIVNQATATSVVSLNSPTAVGENVRLRATVAALNTGVGQPTEGVVRFFVNNVDRGTAPLVGGIAEIEIPGALFPTAGQLSIFARYEGGGSFNPSASTIITHDVRNLTGVNLKQSAIQTTFGQLVTFDAYVRGRTLNGPANLIPPGSVTFIIDGVAQNPVNLVNGKATLQLRLSGGFHTIQARYNGSPVFAESSSTVIGHTTNRAGTTTQILSNRTPASVGQEVIATAVVRSVVPNGGFPVGNVNFLVNGVLRASVALNANGVARLNVGALPLGATRITVQYTGSTNHLMSAASMLQQVVGPARLAGALIGSPLNGQIFTLRVVALGNDNTLAPGFNGPASFTVLSAPPGGNVLGVRNTNFNNGVADFAGLRLTARGTYRIRVVTVGGLFVDLTIDNFGRLT